MEVPLNFPSQGLKGVSFHRSPPTYPSESHSTIRDQPLESIPFTLECFLIEGLTPSKVANVQLVLPTMRMLYIMRMSSKRAIAGRILCGSSILEGRLDLYLEFCVILRS